MNKEVTYRGVCECPRTNRINWAQYMVTLSREVNECGSTKWTRAWHTTLVRVRKDYISIINLKMFI